MNQTHAQVATVDITPGPATTLQRACGCGASAGISGRCPACEADDRLDIQPKLALSTPGDRYEQEADRIADRVASSQTVTPTAPGATLERQNEDDKDELQAKPEGLQRAMDQEEEEETGLQAKSTAGRGTAAAIGHAASVVTGGGRPLSATERGFFEPRLGRDLASVRLHTGADAGAAAAGINARAYTLRNHIAFAPGSFDSGSTEGRRLIAHELVHTLQQGRGERISRKPSRAHGSRRAKRQLTLARVGKPFLKRFVERVARGEIAVESAPERRRRRWSRRAARALALIDAGELTGVTDETIEKLREIKYFIKGEPILIEAGGADDDQDAADAQAEQERIEALRAANPGEPPQGHDCDKGKKNDPYSGDTLRQAVSTAMLMAVGAEQRLRSTYNAGDPLFEEVFETADQAARLQALLRFKLMAEELSKIRVSWGNDPNPPEDQVPAFQKFVCFDVDDFACRYDHEGKREDAQGHTSRESGDDVFLCRGFFKKLSKEKQAWAVLHEIAHHAPLDPRAGLREPTIKKPDVLDDYGYFSEDKDDDYSKLASKTRLKNVDHHVEYAQKALSAASVPGKPAADVDGCSEKQEAQIPQITEDARQLIEDAIPKVRMHHVECWFGSREQAPRVFLAIANVREILNARGIDWSCRAASFDTCNKARPVEVNNKGTKKVSRPVAFVGNDQRGRVVNLCPLFWASPTSHDGRSNPKHRILIHELFHVQGAARKPEEYAPPLLRDLACNDSESALEMAENYVQLVLDALELKTTCPPCGSASPSDAPAAPAGDGAPEQTEPRADVQTKPRVSTPGDADEQEADRIAERVVSTDPTAPWSSAATRLQRAAEGEDEAIQSKGATTGHRPDDEEVTLPANSPAISAGPSATARAAAAVSTGGRPLSPMERGYFEPRMGRDLSAVRLHDDATAGTAALGIHARAYTLRNQIALAPGAYDPRSTDGRRLMAHELVHTLQQQAEAPLLQREAVPEGYAESIPAANTADAALETEEIDAAFIFAGGDYGNAARSYIESFYPDHLLLSARSFEALFDALFGLLQKSRTRGHDPHLRELIIVSHGNAAGGLQIPLVKGKKNNFNLWTLSELQQDFRSELHQKYQRRRSEVVADLIDTDTTVIVRACEFGQAPEALDALRTFFGGTPTVWAPKGFQGYEPLEIGDKRNDLLRTPEEAFDFLMEADYLPEHLLPLDEEDKRTYIARVFGLKGTVPAVFFVMGDENHSEYKKLKKQKKDRTKQAEAMGIKEREDAGRPTDGKYWEDSRLPYNEVPDPALAPLSIEELEARARALLANYRPEIAYMIVRLREEWQRKTTRPIVFTGQQGDPLGGLPPVEVFGGSSVRRDAERFPGPAIDAFETQTILPPEGEPSDEYSEGLAPEGEAEPGGGARRPPKAEPSEDERPGRSARPPGRVAAEDFSKSRGFAKAPIGPETEPLEIEAILERLPPEIDRGLAEAFLGSLPREGWSASDYISATNLTVRALTAPLTFAEATTAVLAIQGITAVIVLPLLGFAGAYFKLSAASEHWERASTGLGIEIGYEKLAGSFSDQEVPSSFDAETFKEGLGSDRRVQSQIAHNVPFYGRHVLGHVENGVEKVAHDSNATIEATDKGLAKALAEAGLSGQKLDGALRAGKHMVRARFLRELIRIGQERLNDWRAKTTEER